MSRRIPAIFNKRMLTSATASHVPRAAMLFPGQGSQVVGMGKDLYDMYPRSAKAVFDEADEALGEKLSSLIFDGEQADLTLTQNAQPAILTTSIAFLRVLEVERGFDIARTCKYVLGHSLGEYTALVATEAVSLADAVRLVRLRGEAMSQAVADKETAMSALMLRKGRLNDLESSISHIQRELSPEEWVEIANINSSSQVVVSGTRQGVEQAVQTLQQQRISARATPLPVSAPFHCELMQEAASTMKEAFQQISFSKPCVDVISNVTHEPYKDAAAIPDLLVQQITSTVQWLRSVEYCQAHAVEEYISLGPGQVLANLLAKDKFSNNIRTVASQEDIARFTQ